jgi:hypothetical protein
MGEVRRWQTRLVAAGVLLAACGEQEDSDSSFADGSVIQPASGAPGGMVAIPGGPLGGNAGGTTPIFPGTMPAPPDASVLAPADASVPAPRDASVPAVRDASTAATPRGPVDLSQCMPPPMGASAQAVEAWTIINEMRLAGGAGCMNMVPALNTSAQSHCDYRAMNRSNPSCMADAHSQIAGCPGFTGLNAQAREIAAGYPRALAYTEVALTYGNNPKLAIPGWMVTPYHRIPLVDPWTTDMGWGGGPGCDVIDIGRGMVRPPDSTISVYPYDGQTEVPTSFNGLESPQPPPPASGWPSSFPVSIYAQRLNITEHVMTKDGDATPLEHIFLDTKNPGVAQLRAYFGNTAMLYGAAFEPSTTYRVKMVGSYAGGALNTEWTFTTSARRPTRF